MFLCGLIRESLRMVWEPSICPLGFDISFPTIINNPKVQEMMETFCVISQQQQQQKKSEK